jgi:hypothetical protein
MFKTLYRNNGTYRKIGVHRPRDAKDADRLDAFRWFDCEGRELGAAFKTRRLFSNYGRPNYGLAQLNHYPLGCMESYILKAARGRAVHSEHMLGTDYWVERNFNTDTDSSIDRYEAARTALEQELLQDAELKALRDTSVAWRHQTFRELMQQEPFRALFSRLLMTPQSRLINAVTAQTLSTFASLGRAAEKAEAEAAKPPDATEN